MRCESSVVCLTLAPAPLSQCPTRLVSVRRSCNPGSPLRRYASSSSFLETRALSDKGEARPTTRLEVEPGEAQPPKDEPSNRVCFKTSRPAVPKPVESQRRQGGRYSSSL